MAVLLQAIRDGRRWQFPALRHSVHGPLYNRLVEKKRDGRPVENLSSQLDQRRIDFLNADLKICFTFADLAETELKMRDREGAEMAIANCQRGYETINRFLSDPKHLSHMTGDQIHQLRAELAKLRERLDRLQNQR